MNTKTPGQVMYESFYPDYGSKWEHARDKTKWEAAASAVIAHHEASKQPQPKFKINLPPLTLTSGKFSFASV